MIDDDRKPAPDEHDPDLEAVGKTWRRLSKDEPPALLDQAVLNRARRDLETAGPRRLRWLGHFATAGVAVIALSVWLLQDRSPVAPGGDATLRVAPPAEESASKPAAAPEPQSRRLAPSVLSEQAPMAPSNEARAKGAPAEALRSEPAKAAPVARARSAADEATQVRAPEAWIEDLLALQAAGQVEELRTELEAFRVAYPDYPLPPALGGD